MSAIFWIDLIPPAPLAIVQRPRGGRALKKDLLEMKRSGIDTLVSLLPEEEAEMLGLDAEGRMAEEAGLQFLSFPMPDRNVPPDEDAFRSFVAELAYRLCGGEHVGIHCQGSIGRSTVTAACTLMHLGWEPWPVLSAITKARGLAVPDTEQQEEWILGYKAQP